MPIEVKHGAHPASTLYAKYAGTKGAAMRRSLEKFLQINARQGEQRRERDFRREMYEAGHERDLEKMDLAQGHRLELADRGYRQAMARQLFANFGRQQGGRGGGGGRVDPRRLYEYKLTADQRAEDAKWARTLNELENNEDYSPEEKSEIRRQIWAKRAGIQEELHLRDEPTDINEKMQYHEGTGKYFYSEPGGKLQEFGGFDAEKLLPLAINSATTVNAETGKSTTDWEEVGDFMQNAAKFSGAQMGGGQREVIRDAILELTVEPKGLKERIEAYGFDTDAQMGGGQREVIRDAILELTVEPKGLKERIEAYGFDTEYSDPDKINNIPKALALLNSYKIKLAEHRKKPGRRSGRRPGANVGGGLGMAGGGRTKWEREEKKILTKIERFEKQLEELEGRRRRLIAHFDGMTIANGLGQ